MFQTYDIAFEITCDRSGTKDTGSIAIGAESQADAEAIAQQMQLTCSPGLTLTTVTLRKN